MRLSRAHVFHGHRRFNEGQEVVEDGDRAGRSNIEKGFRPRKAKKVEKCETVPGGHLLRQWWNCLQAYGPQGTTVTPAAYIEILTGFREANRMKRPRLLEMGWCLLRDNAPSYITHRAAISLKAHRSSPLPTLFSWFGPLWFISIPSTQAIEKSKISHFFKLENFQKMLKNQWKFYNFLKIFKEILRFF